MSTYSLVRACGLKGMYIASETQTQTKFIQQKYIQVPYQVDMSFLEIQITL